MAKLQDVSVVQAQECGQWNKEENKHIISNKVSADDDID